MVRTARGKQLDAPAKLGISVTLRRRANLLHLNRIQQPIDNHGGERCTDAFINAVLKPCHHDRRGNLCNGHPKIRVDCVMVRHSVCDGVEHDWRSGLDIAKAVGEIQPVNDAAVHARLLDPRGGRVHGAEARRVDVPGQVRGPESVVAQKRVPRRGVVQEPQLVRRAHRPKEHRMCGEFRPCHCRRQHRVEVPAEQQRDLARGEMRHPMPRGGLHDFHDQAHLLRAQVHVAVPSLVVEAPAKQMHRASEEVEWG
mmetsp:Transcript_55837/g.169956  ORF Transcript_55837/g.169956 Transcript_55837/m.169956 type:complete len:254 (-) Transcript_55837:640-1401(-)